MDIRFFPTRYLWDLPSVDILDKMMVVTKSNVNRSFGKYNCVVYEIGWGVIIRMYKRYIHQASVHLAVIAH